MENKAAILKPFTAYLVGVLTTAIAVSAGNGRWGLICFGLGVLAVASGFVWALRSQERALWVATQIMNWTHNGAYRIILKPKEKRVAKGEDDKPELPKKPSAFAECVLALRGLGSDPETARYLAGQATQRLPEDASTKDVLKLALSINSARA
jgi:hypothetical protein